MENKIWYLSKTLWINVLAIVAIIVQGTLGYNISAEMQVSLLAIINIIMRAITNQPLREKK